MNKLFYVVAYDTRHNQFARFAVTAADEQAARLQVLAQLTSIWRIERSSFVCETPSAIDQEL
jgi:hypothetical protein